MVAQRLNNYDGDSGRITTETGQQEIRLAGIDTPEFNQNFGPQAKQMLQEFVAGHDIDVSFDRGKGGRAKSGKLRDRARLKVDGKDVGVAMVKQGGAWVLRDRHAVGNPALFLAERTARKNREGLWADPALHRKLEENVTKVKAGGFGIIDFFRELTGTERETGLPKFKTSGSPLGLAALLSDDSTVGRITRYDRKTGIVTLRAGDVVEEISLADLAGGLGLAELIPGAPTPSSARRNRG